MNANLIQKTMGFNHLVDIKEGWVDRRIFCEQDIYEQELYRIFARSWRLKYFLTPAPTVATRCASPMPATHVGLPVITTAGLSTQPAP